MALDFLKQLETFHYGGAPPRIEINFGGDLADARTLYADATVWGQQIRRGSAELTQVYAALALRDNVIELKQCNVSDALGEMDASGSYSIETGKAALQLRSTLDPWSIERLVGLGNPFEHWKFGTQPEIELSGTGTLGADVEGLVTGRVAMGTFTVADTDFSGAGGGVFVGWDAMVCAQRVDRESDRRGQRCGRCPCRGASGRKSRATSTRIRCAVSRAASSRMRCGTGTSRNRQKYR